MNASPPVLHFHALKRMIRRNGEVVLFKEQAWRVLELLVKKAPDVVSRQEFIDTIWAGNYETGNKGLNQALWTIRIQLGDDARTPRLVRTVPRQGYQWIYPAVQWNTESGSVTKRPLRAALSVASVFLVASLVVGHFQSNAREDTLFGLSGPGTDSATAARVEQNRIVITMASGCLRFLVPDRQSVKLGTPVLSDDGLHVIFSARELDKCKTISIAVRDGQRQDFQGCLSIQDAGSTTI